jgi:hypothetical protein
MEKGERDPARLCTIGLAALGPVIIDPATRLPRRSGLSESRIAR